MTVNYIFLAAILLSCVYALPPRTEERPEGLSIPEIRLTDGRVFSEVTVRKVNVDSVSIIHSSGSTTIQFELLSSADARKIGFKKEDVEKFRKETLALAEAEKASKAEATKINDILDLYFMNLSGDVLQVLPDGLLLKRCRVWRGNYSSFSSEGKVYYLAIFEEEGSTCRVHCDTRPYVDGSSFVGAVASKGNFTYQNTAGSSSTVKNYTTDLAPMLDAVAKGIARPTILEVIRLRYDIPRLSYSVPP